MKIHRTQQNETLYEIADEYGVSPIRLAYDNEIENIKRLAQGRELLVLTPTRTYNVKTGDTTDKIARRFGISEERLKAYNPELCTSGKLYSGQLLAIKNMDARFGMGIANGYYYIGCTRNMLNRAMPYLSYVTVCAAIAESGDIKMMPSVDTVVSEVHRYGKIPLLRIYVKDDTDMLSGNFIDSATILAKAGGYDGITLSRPPAADDKDKLIELKKTMLERELLLFVEKDISDTHNCTDYADATVLTYDKLHLECMPTFEEGEKKAMTAYAEFCTPEGAFIELSAFSMIGEKYVEKVRANSIADKNKAILLFDKDTLTLSGNIGRGKKVRRLRQESLENTKAKLELASELGYLGISFDNKEFQNQGYDVIDITNDIVVGEHPKFSLKLIRGE